MTRLGTDSKLARAERRKAELWLIQIGPDPQAYLHLHELAREVLSESEYVNWVNGHGQFSKYRSPSAKDLTR